MRNSSRGAVDPFIVMDVMEAARQMEEEGRHIVHMEVGQPSSGAPVGAVRAVREALGSDDPMGYTVALGIPELRERIAELDAEGRKAVLVSHQVNITALTGVYPGSGEIVVIRLGEDGEVRVEGRIGTD